MKSSRHRRRDILERATSQITRRTICDRAPRRYLLAKPAVSSIGVVIRNIFAQQPPKVALILDDYAVEHLLARAADRAFQQPVLPRA